MTISSSNKLLVTRSGQVTSTNTVQIEQREHSVSCTVTCDCVTQTTLYYFFQSKLSMEDWNKNDERKLREGIEKFRGRGREFFNIDKRAEYRAYAEEKEKREERRLQERLEEWRQEQERVKKEQEEEQRKKKEEEEESQSLLEVAERNAVTPAQKIKYEKFSKIFRDYRGKKP